MKTRTLKPSLAAIEARLCGPSDGMLRRWRAGGDALPADLLAQLENDPEALWRRQNLDLGEQDDDEGAESVAQPLERPARPDLLMQFSKSVQRREALSRADFPAVPMPGQIRYVEHLCAPDGTAIPWDFPQQLMVVLRAPATAGSPIWYGWMVAPDVDYAAYWDMVLEPRDEPRDPRAELAQGWNTVLIDTRGVGKVAGQLSGERLAALEALSDDFLDGAAVGTKYAAPGELIERTLEGHRVVTGTPYGAPESDPRLEYQSLYHTAAEPLRIHARAVLETGNTVQPTSNVVIFNSFLQRQAARQATGSMRPAYQYQALDRMAKAASSVEAPPEIAHIYDGLLSVHFSAVPEFDGLTRCTLGRAGPTDVAVQVARNGRVIVDAILSAAEPTEEFTFDSTDDVILRMTTPTALEVRISPVTD